MSSSKINHVIEIVWLVISVLSLIAGIHKTFNSSIAESYPFFIMALISIFIYSLRRYVRTKIKNNSDLN